MFTVAVFFPLPGNKPNISSICDLTIEMYSVDTDLSSREL